MGKPIEILDAEFDGIDAYVIKARFKDNLEYLQPEELDELNTFDHIKKIKPAEFAQALIKNTGSHSGAYVLIRVSLEAYETNYIN